MVLLGGVATLDALPCEQALCRYFHGLLRCCKPPVPSGDEPEEPEKVEAEAVATAVSNHLESLDGAFLEALTSFADAVRREDTLTAREPMLSSRRTCLLLPDELRSDGGMGCLPHAWYQFGCCGNGQGARRRCTLPSSCHFSCIAGHTSLSTAEHKHCGLVGWEQCIAQCMPGESVSTHLWIS